MRLAPKGSVAWHFIFGDVVHEALADYYQSKRDASAMHASFIMAWKNTDGWLQERYGAFYSMGIEEEWQNYQVKGTEMLRNYDMFDRSKKKEFYKKIIAVDVEERSYVPILNPYTGKPLPGNPLLTGRIDLVVQREDGIWIVDHKTAAQKNDSRALDVDDQLTGYCYIWYRISGKVPQGAIYNVLIKDPPHPPKILKSGELSKDKAQRTTFELYLQAIHNQGLDPNDYEEHLNWLGQKEWTQFFIREGVERNLEELQSFEERLYHEYLDMELAIDDDKKRYPNMSQWNCQGCTILPLCQTLEEQGDELYIIDGMYEVQEPRYEIPEGV